jgi:glycerol-3-phosphate acyltransferase PlsX
MGVGLRMLQRGEGDAFVSAGNTGALLAGATLLVRRIKGIRRAAIATVLPFPQPVLLMDAGANLTVTAEDLEQFAYMGSFYMEKVHGMEHPRIGLLNNGAEATKGLALQQETYEKLSQNEDIYFVGNIEGKDIPFDSCDVLLADGYTGNIVLKYTEGMGKFMLSTLKQLFMQNAATKVAALAMKKQLSAMKKQFDASEYGGAPLLGISKPVIKAHGGSDAKAIKNAVLQTIAFLSTGINHEIARMAAELDLKQREKKKAEEADGNKAD